MPDAPLIVAVSGGADSLALLLLAHAALGARVSAITVDHGLRAESAEEARHVAEVCARRGIAHRIETPGALAHGNLQAEARRARYDIVAGAAIEAGGFVATAHHADDQLETMLMRLNRGSGVAGLAGIRAHVGPVVRPLLGWRRAELAAVVAACGEAAIDDPSNRDDRFDRARLRKDLAEVDWLDPVAASRSAAALDEAEEAIRWAVAEAVRRYVEETGDGRVMLDAGVMRDEDFPRELKRRLLLYAVERIDPGCAPRETLLARALVTLRDGRAITVGRAVVRPTRDHWLCERAPLPRAVPDPADG